MTFIHLGPPGKNEGSEFDRLVGQLHGAAPARRHLADEFAAWMRCPLARCGAARRCLYLGITVVVLVIDLVKNVRER